MFTHDAVVRAVVARALGTGPEINRHVEVGNCSITMVEVVAGVRRLLEDERVRSTSKGLVPDLDRPPARGGAGSGCSGVLSR